jgi:hypothetical protein
MNLKVCRICHGSSFRCYLNLGFTPPADSFLRAQGLQQPEVYYPLEVYLCLECGISQLGYTVSPDILYQQDYPYESSTTRAGRTHFFNFATSVVDRFKLGSKNLAIDVGSNVGVLLDGFKTKGCRILGIEPSANIAAIAVGRGVETINDFISPKLASQVVEDYGRASVVTATNVFAHIDELDGFMEAVDTLLDDRGVLIIEAPHFLKLIQHLEYDTIYHEHLLYIAVRPLNRLFSRFGYEVFDVEEVGIHGGSIRIYVSRSGRYPSTAALGKLLEAEETNRIFDFERLSQFSHDVAAHRLKLTTLLRSLKAEGASLAGVSAPAKGMTLLNYCRIGPELLDFVTEKSRLKIGRYTPGMHIPILPDAALVERRPDYALLLAWNFADEIIENLREYRDKGGKFIIPIPEPIIV